MLSLNVAHITRKLLASPLLKQPYLSSAIVRGGFLSTSRLYSTQNEDESNTNTGHQPPSNAGAASFTKEEEELITKFQTDQKSLKRLSFAEEVRSLLDQSLCYGTLSTNSADLPGYPTGSIVGFELDNEGYPFFVFSSMSAHTKDIMKDGRCSLTVVAKNFKGAAEGRVVLVGDVKKVKDGVLKESLREKYLARHEGAYWVDFGDFTYFRMDKIEAVRFVGGFAMAGSVTPEEYAAASADPISAIAEPVMKHMNDDHSDSTVAMVKHYTGLPCSEAVLVSLDKFGLTAKAKLELGPGGYLKVRMNFPRPAADRKDVKTLIVEMTKASTA